MRRSFVVALFVVLVSLVLADVVQAQDGRSIVLRRSGQILIKDGEGDFGTLELNLHNSNWKYASQVDATAKCEEKPGGGKAFTGALMIPDVAGAAMSFLETITPGDDGLRIVYELRPSGPMVLNGMQISLVLPTDRFGGQQLVVKSAEAADRTVALPRALNPAQWQLGTIEGNAVQVGADEATGLSMKIDKAYGLIIHDLRQWERDEFEVRIPLIQEAEGKMIGANDRWDVEITLGPGTLEVTGP